MAKPSPTTKRAPRTPQPIRSDAIVPAGDGPVFLPPLRPNRRLLILAAGLLAAWLGFLLYLHATAASSRGHELRSGAGPAAATTQPTTSPAPPTTGVSPR